MGSTPVGGYVAAPVVPSHTLPSTPAIPPTLVAPPPPGPWYRKSKEVLTIPEELPSVNTLQVWLAKVATALTDASARNDKAEVGWFVKATDSS